MNRLQSRLRPGMEVWNKKERTERMESIIQQNLELAKQHLDASCVKTGRSSRDITLIAVSKTKPVSMLQEAYDYGCRDFGENKVQELLEKYEVMPKDIRWHMIGHLQTNKVRHIIDKVALIHSVDSLHLAQAISREAVKLGRSVQILIEVNVAGEESKFGVSVKDAPALVTEIAALPGISIQGLMTIAPYVENAEDNRQHFAVLRQLSVDIMNKNIDNVNMSMLSMGMTGDYRIAAEEGATHVRIGTGIFGERQYT